MALSSAIRLSLHSGHSVQWIMFMCVLLSETCGTRSAAVMHAGGADVSPPETNTPDVLPSHNTTHIDLPVPDVDETQTDQTPDSSGHLEHAPGEIERTTDDLRAGHNELSECRLIDNESYSYNRSDLSTLRNPLYLNNTANQRCFQKSNGQGDCVCPEPLLCGSNATLVNETIWEDVEFFCAPACVLTSKINYKELRAVDPNTPNLPHYLDNSANDQCMKRGVDGGTCLCPRPLDCFDQEIQWGQSLYNKYFCVENITNYNCSGDCDFLSIYDRSVQVLTMNETEYSQQLYGEDTVAYLGQPLEREWDSTAGRMVPIGQRLPEDSGIMDGRNYNHGLSASEMDEIANEFQLAEEMSTIDEQDTLSVGAVGQSSDDVSAIEEALERETGDSAVTESLSDMVAAAEMNVAAEVHVSDNDDHSDENIEAPQDTSDMNTMTESYSGTDMTSDLVNMDTANSTIHSANGNLDNAIVEAMETTSENEDNTLMTDDTLEDDSMDNSMMGHATH